MKIQVVEAHNKKNIGLVFNLPTVIKAGKFMNGADYCFFKETITLNGKEYNARLTLAHEEIFNGEVCAKYTDCLSLFPVVGNRGGTVFSNVKILTGDYIDGR